LAGITLFLALIVLIVNITGEDNFKISAILLLVGFLLGIHVIGEIITIIAWILLYNACENV